VRRRHRPRARVALRVVEDPQQARHHGPRRLEADLLTQDRFRCLRDRLPVAHEPAGQSQPGRLTSSLNEHPQLGRCSGIEDRQHGQTHHTKTTA